jgi:lipopolysaccharide/colanic/teichoic acid biosynthesis glycosyltransferase
MKLQESMTGFYYVGSKRAVITKLVNIYKRGYASGKLNESMAELLNKEHILPQVIIFDASYGVAAIKQWSDLIKKNKRLYGIPLIIDSENTNAIENFQFIRNKTADDIINVQECDENDLNLKILFLQKYKCRSRDFELKQKEEILAVVPEKMHSYFKRALDIAISITAILFFLPVFLIIALAIRIESRGNIFYVSKRAGMGYRIFNFYKFRTMSPDAELNRTQYVHLNLYPYSEMARFFKVENDPRITKVGRFLRNTSLDELPQLFNVLRGDMSLVGNRPLPLYEAENLTTDELAKRFMAPAGITGLWQVKKRGKADMSADERIDLDLNYADKSNLLMDMWIMAHTPQALMQKAKT